MGLPTTIEFIDDGERRIGVKIPSNIKSMILINNGGAECIDKNCPNEVWSLFAVKDMSSRSHIKRTANHIERETLSAKEWANFPKDVIAIGDNGCGDYLIAKKHSDKTYIWRHETGKTIQIFLTPWT